MPKLPLSNCCEAPFVEESDICSECFEHASHLAPVSDSEEGQADDELAPMEESAARMKGNVAAGEGEPLSQEAKRIRIAEACGWKPRLRESGETCWFKNNKEGMATKPEHLPDYFTDLNAMHEAEKTLEGANLWTFRRTLSMMFTDHPDDGFRRAIHATASQRAEAFGLTLELWK